jgi:DNA methylase
MLEDALLDMTERGDIVLDPFLDSGSTLIAAKRLAVAECPGRIHWFPNFRKFFGCLRT